MARMMKAEVLEVFRQAPAAPEPTECALNNPSFGQHLEAVRCVGSLDDLERDLGLRLHRGGGCRALIAAIGDGARNRRTDPAHDIQERRDHIAILDIGRCHGEAVYQAQRVDRYVALLALDFLARIVPRGINIVPPFSALFTLWLSTMVVVGVAAFPANSRTSQ